MYMFSFCQRLDVLLRENRHQDAIALALTFYEGTAKAVIGLSHNPKRRKEVVANKVRVYIIKSTSLFINKSVQVGKRKIYFA